MEKRIVKVGRLKIKVYPRRGAGCDHKPDCKCIRWMQYQLNGKQQRETTSEWTWDRAVKAAEARGRELEGLDGRKPVGVTIQVALDNWLAWREREHRGNKKQKVMSMKLLEWACTKKIFFLHEITKSELLAWRNTWKYRAGDSSSLKVHSCVLGSFFAFCVGADLLKDNPFPKGPQFVIRYRRRTVVPITMAEMDRLIATIDLMDWNSQLKQRMLALVLLMRWSGLAIGDATALKRCELEGNRIRTNRQKTGEVVYVPIPQFVVTALQAVTNNEPEYFFWYRCQYGTLLKRSSLAGVYSQYFLSLFRAAEVKGTPHGLRHAFATHHLANGARVEDVAQWLGHHPNETRRTYAHWIQESQNRLDEAMKQSWQRMGLDAAGNHLAVQ